MARTHAQAFIYEGDSLTVTLKGTDATLRIGGDDFVAYFMAHERVVVASQLRALAADCLAAADELVPEAVDDSASELVYSDGPDDSGYRAEMRDAGRGAQVR